MRIIIEIQLSDKHFQLFNLFDIKSTTVFEVRFKYSFFLLGFTPHKAKQPLRGIELKEKSTKRLKHTGNLIRKNLHLKGVC